MTKEIQQQMDSDQEFNPNDPARQRDRIRAQTLLKIYNDTSPEDKEKRNTIMRLLLKSAGKAFDITPPFYCDYGYNITIGENFCSNFNCVILDCGLVTIGDNVMLGPNVQIYTATSPIDSGKRGTELESAKPIIIEDNVWIGGGTIIVPGITIGHGTTIGAGSVVTSNIPPNVVAAGNPCRIIRKILD